MKKKIFVLLASLLASPTGQVLACATCMGAKDSKSTAHMAIAIWVMIAAVMSVLGGVSAFGVHLWRHATIPLEPHEQLIDEDLDKYD
ncbi:MAG: hypothetical protein ACR2MW_03310 [Chthoniobacterales bacterium]